MSSTSQSPSLLFFFFSSLLIVPDDSFHDTKQSRCYKSCTPANIWNSKCCNFRVFPQDLPDWNTWPVCTSWAMCQHVLCLYTSILQREMSPVHLQSWSAPSSKPNISIQNSSHQDTELFCTCLVWPFIQDFQTSGSPTQAIDMVEEMSKYSRQTKKVSQKR